jgi:hypothetical protein
MTPMLKPVCGARDKDFIPISSHPPPDVLPVGGFVPAFIGFQQCY